MPNFTVHSSTLNQNGTYTTSGLFANPTNPNAPITWYGQVNVQNNGGWTEYDGQLGGELADNNMSTPANTQLAALGFTAVTSLALSDTNSPQSTVTDVMSYSFSSSIPTGTQFYLWDPGSEFNGTSGTSTFTFSGTSGGTKLQNSDFTLTPIAAFPGFPQQGTYTTNVSTGSLTVTNYVGAKQPEEVVLVTADKPIDSITVTASTIGNDIFGFGLAAPGAAVTDTVTGASGTIVSMPMSSTIVGAVAQGLLSAVSAGIANATLLSYVNTASAPSISSTQGTVQQVDAGGLVAMATSDTGLVIDAVTPVTAFGGAAANESIVSALGSLVFVAGTGTGTVVGGGSNNTFIATNKAAGNYSVYLGAGNDTVLTAVGSDYVDAGAGNNLIWLGTGTSQIVSEGADTIVGQAGAATVWAGGTSDLVFGGTGGLQFVGGAMASTVVGLGGALTVSGGAGGGFFFGAPKGGNQITAGAGRVTIFGGGTGDVLSAGAGSAGALISGGPGAETLTGAGSSGNNTFYGGYGNELIYGGTGSTTFINGPGASTMYGGTGTNTYFFDNGREYSPATVYNFVNGRDFISLQGYGTGAGAATAKTATTTGGNTTITLPDTTTVTFMGVNSLTATSFV